MIEWLWPAMFLLAPLPLLLRHLLQPAERPEAALLVPDVASFASETSAGQLSSSLSRLSRLGLLWLCWLAAITALARPQWAGEEVSLPASGRDLMLAVDISGSMGTEDMQLGDRFVNRLAVVKTVVADFLKRRAGDRIGLILFGSNAYLQAPLTFDLASVERLLVEAPVGIAGGKTAIGDAIGLAVKRLRQKQDGERVLILLTDGANNVGAVAPVKAAELAQLEDIQIYTIGVGADEMQLKMPGLFGALGSRVVNPSAELDEDTLSAIARLTDGRYFRARDTDRLREIYDEIDAMEPVEQEAERYRPIRALYHWPLGIALILFAALLLLRRQNRGTGTP
ncbi:MAG: VWA domain-containing protein [Pseudomonadota bacterium]